MTAVIRPKMSERTGTGSEAYWDAYYRRGEAPTTPSQFAVFVFDEVAYRAGALVDVGCGSGRDAFFFARNAIPTVGLDASSEAIAFCRSRHADEPGLPVSFVDLDVEDPDVADRITGAVADHRRGSGPLVLYARFFLHAVQPSAQAHFLDWASRLLSETEGVLALEFRTERDRQQAKHIDDHYRRFVDPMEAIAAAQARGLRLDYFVEGFGFARLRGEDAHVARCLFSP